MMKRMKGVSAPFDSSSFAEDPRVRLRHQSLVRDYEDLYKETEAQRNKLEMMKKKRMILLAEVRFLRRRYMCLKQSQNPNSEPKSVRRPKLSNGSAVDLNRKKRNNNDKETASLRAIPDLNQKERVYSGKDMGARNNAPIFDLNQISMEEEEYQANGEGMRIDESKACSVIGGNNDQNGDVKLSGCRSVGNGSNRGGKRKISWQDQVALRA